MKTRRNVKDSVFTHLFSIPKYRRELYLSLHPEDANIGEDEIESVTLSNILSSGLYNDLGIYVKKRLIILVEAQSIWTENILWRLLYYLAESYKRKWIEEDLNIYGTKKVYLPLPELYVVYTGNKEVKEEISLKEEFFTNEESAIDLKVKVIITKEELCKNNMQKVKKYDIMQESGSNGLCNFRRIYSYKIA